MMERFALGFDVGGSSVKGGLFAGDHLLESWEFPADVSDGAIRVVPSIAQSAAAVLEAHGMRKEEVVGIGVALACPVAEDGRCGSSPKLPWDGYDARAAIERACRLPAVIGNDAAFAALGEGWLGSAQGARDILCYTLGTGIGVGIISDGRPLYGARGYAGEVSKLPADLVFESGLWDAATQLDDALSATGIVAMAEAMLAAGGPSALSQESAVTAETVLSAWAAGDEVAAYVVEAFSDAFGRLAAMQCATLAPEVIVIAGGVALAGRPFIDRLQGSCFKHFGALPQTVRVEAATLGKHSGVFGAAKAAYDCASGSSGKAVVDALDAAESAGDDPGATSACSAGDSSGKIPPGT